MNEIGEMQQFYVSIILKGLALDLAYTPVFTRGKKETKLDSFIGFLQQPALTWSFYFRRENFAHIFCQQYLLTFVGTTIVGKSDVASRNQIFWEYFSIISSVFVQNFAGEFC